MTYHIALLERTDITTYSRYLASERLFIEQYNTKQPHLFYTRAYQTMRYITQRLNGEAGVHYLIRETDTDHIIGYIRLYHVKKNRDTRKKEGVLAFALHPAHAGKHIMQQMLPHFLQSVRASHQIDTIRASVHHDNIACIRTLEHNGFTEYPYVESKRPKGEIYLAYHYFIYQFA